jgi:hypothetical protein
VVLRGLDVLACIKAVLCGRVNTGYGTPGHRKTLTEGGIVKTASLMLMIRTRSSAAVVVAAFALASCAAASPETKAGDAFPPPETAQESVANQILDRVDDAPNDPPRPPADPDTVPPEHKKSFQSTYRLALDGRDYELQVSGLHADGAHHPLGCRLEGLELGGEALKCEVAGRYDGTTSLFEYPFHDIPQLESADADGAYASLADGLMPDEPATLTEDEQDRLLKLHLYESTETGDLRLIWGEGAGLAFQWKLKLQRE